MESVFPKKRKKKMCVFNVREGDEKKWLAECFGFTKSKFFWKLVPDAWWAPCVPKFHPSLL